MKNHSRRVAALAGVLCRCLQLDDETTHQFVLSAHLHDIGKAGVPKSIIMKPGPLTPTENRLVRRHTDMGATALKSIGYGIPAIVALRHHEAWDGSGYPDGLKEYDIPFAARVVAVCDVYSALREHRPYRKGMAHDEALHVMLEGDGRAASPTKLDPHLLAGFAGHHLRFKAVADAISNTLSVRGFGGTASVTALGMIQSE